MMGDKRELKYLYLSGPYTLGDTALNVRNAIEAGDTLISEGYVPFIPHLSHFQHLICPRNYEDWMSLDLQWIERCDALIRLPGESSGADREMVKADELGKPVFLGLNSFLKQEGQI